MQASSRVHEQLGISLSLCVCVCVLMELVSLQSPITRCLLQKSREAPYKCDTANENGEFTKEANKHFPHQEDRTSELRLPHAEDTQCIKVKPPVLYIK